MNWIFLSILSISVLASCAKQPDIHIPKDEATSSEKRHLQQIKSEIVKLFKQEGVHLDLNDVPIVVSSENLEGNAGLCVRDGDGAPVYMQLSPLLLSRSRSDLHSSAVEEPGFIILLHEIGHCYFGREHDPAKLRAEDHLMVFTEKTSGGPSTLALTHLPVSIMAEDYDSLLPNSLKIYYVRELLGRDRFTHAKDLLRYSDVELIRTR